MSSIEDKPSKVLDATGLLCPMPVIRTNQAVKEVQIGEILEVLTTDPGSKPDLTSWARMTGNEIIDISEGPGTPTIFKFRIRRLK